MNNSQSNNNALLFDLKKQLKQYFQLWQYFYLSDPNSHFLIRALQIFSKFTWECPQTLLGIIWAHVLFVFDIQSIENHRGAIMIHSRCMPKRSGLSLGGIICLGEGADQRLKRHEYGHYIQSRFYGPLFLLVFGLPSFIRANYIVCRLKCGLPYHKDYEDFYTEESATRLGEDYFDRAV